MAIYSLQYILLEKATLCHFNKKEKIIYFPMNPNQLCLKPDLANDVKLR